MSSGAMNIEFPTVQNAFYMLTFVFVHTGMDMVLACITGTFVANVFLVTVLLCTEHMLLRRDTWT